MMRKTLTIALIVLACSVAALAGTKPDNQTKKPGRPLAELVMEQQKIIEQLQKRVARLEEKIKDLTGEMHKPEAPETMTLKAHINGSSVLALGKHRAQWKHNEDAEPRDVSINGARWHLKWKGQKGRNRYSNLFVTSKIPDFTRMRIARIEVDPKKKESRVSFINHRDNSQITIDDSLHGSEFYTIKVFLEPRQ